jgi:hypothetical protein
MSRFPFCASVWASTLMLAGAPTAQAQTPHSQRTTSAGAIQQEGASLG